MTSDSSAKPANGDGAASANLADLLYGLRQRGFVIGVDDAERIAGALRHSGNWDHPRRIRALKALLARTDAERETIEQLAPFLFPDAFHRGRNGSVPDDIGGRVVVPPDPSPDPEPPPREERPRMVTYALVAVLGLALVALAVRMGPQVYRSMIAPPVPVEEDAGGRDAGSDEVGPREPDRPDAGSDDGESPIDPDPVDAGVRTAQTIFVEPATTESVSAVPAFFVGVFGILSLLALLWYRRSSRMPDQVRLALRELADNEGGRVFRFDLPASYLASPLDPDDVREAAFHLSAPTATVEGDRLDGDRTIDATVRAAGRLSLRYEAQRAHRPIIFIEDRGEGMSRWPDHGRQIFEALSRQGGDVRRWYMERRPEPLFARPDLTDGIPLEQVLADAEDAEVVVFSDASGLDAQRGWAQAPWIGALSGATWLHPRPMELWNRGAHRLSTMLSVVPVSADGLLRLAAPGAGEGTSLQARRWPMATAAGDIEDRVAALRGALGFGCFRWLAASAVLVRSGAQSTRVMWALLVERVIRVPWHEAERIWDVPELQVAADGSVSMDRRLQDALIEWLRQHDAALLSEVVTWASTALERVIESLDAGSMAKLSAEATLTRVLAVDPGRKSEAREKAEGLVARGFGGFLRKAGTSRGEESELRAPVVRVPPRAVVVAPVLGLVTSTAVLLANLAWAPPVSAPAIQFASSTPGISVSREGLGTLGSTPFVYPLTEDELQQEIEFAFARQSFVPTRVPISFGARLEIRLDPEDPLPAAGAMVGVPAGPFLMGCNKNGDARFECGPREDPLAMVDVPAFYIDRTEVTVAQFRKCRAAGCRRGFRPYIKDKKCNYGHPDRNDHPMNCISVEAAESYCDSVGKRLPTEAEWEKAARGTDGRTYPWGHTSADCTHAVIRAPGTNEPGCGRGTTWPVGAKPTGASPYGALDMIGNVYEWVKDEDGTRQLKGGSFGSSAVQASASSRAVTDRSALSVGADAVGFRCAEADLSVRVDDDGCIWRKEGRRWVIISCPDDPPIGPDAGFVADAGFVPDAGFARDSGFQRDMGFVRDSGFEPDGGFSPDVPTAPMVDCGDRRPWDSDGDGISDAVEAANRKYADVRTGRCDADPTRSNGGRAQSGVVPLLNLPDRGTGYMHFRGTDGLDSDDWGTLALINCIEATGRALAPDGITIGVGDLSRRGGGRFLPHTNHQNGLDVELRYVRKDRKDLPLDLRFQLDDYDKAATEKMFRAFLKNCDVVEMFVDIDRLGFKIPGSEERIIHVAGHSNKISLRIKGSGASGSAATPARPRWANAVGKDRYGTYADVVIPGSSARFRMRLIQPGTFTMGSPASEKGRFDDEGPQHKVTLTKAFWMADAPCTQEVYEAVTGNNPSRFKGKDYPVETVSWDDAQVFLKAINKRIPGIELRLPTEAEWEYAARAGTTAARYGQIDGIAWYSANSKRSTHSVRQKAPNAWGLYDSLGNVWEWCQDRYGPYTSGAQVDPIGPSKGSLRVQRGGSWRFNARFVRAAARYASDPSSRDYYTGFRLSRGQDEPRRPEAK